MMTPKETRHNGKSWITELKTLSPHWGLIIVQQHAQRMGYGASTPQWRMISENDLVSTMGNPKSHDKNPVPTMGIMPTIRTTCTMHVCQLHNGGCVIDYTKSKITQNTYPQWEKKLSPHWGLQVGGIGITRYRSILESSHNMHNVCVNSRMEDVWFHKILSHNGKS